MAKPMIPDVLADRYASTGMAVLHSPMGKIIAERRLWIAALKAMQSLGRDIPDEAIAAYEAVVEVIDLASIAKREAKSRHDVTARIQEFNALAGYDLAHAGFTSRDLTENVEQQIIFESLNLIHHKMVAVLGGMRRRALEFQLMAICGRSHLVPGQATTIGKRFANWAEELLLAFADLETFIGTYPLRGIKGPMGTEQDMVKLLGNKAKARKFEATLARYLGMQTTFTSVGQVYPRMLDFMTISKLNAVASACANMALNIRLMSGLGLGHEGFGKEQTGSSAMPHKTNCRTSERIHGFMAILAGYLTMVQHLLGDQWFEGDVSCSVVRRVAIQGAFFAIDGLLEAALTILRELQVFPEMVRAELEMYLPFLATSNLLTAAIKTGAGREQVHGVIKFHAVAVITEWRQGKLAQPGAELHARLARDPDYPLEFSEITPLIRDADTGLAREQVDAVAARIQKVLDRFPDYADYVPEPIL